MLLEIENQLYSRVHSAIGQSAVVLRLAEELDQSGRVAEQTMIIVSYVSGSSTNEMGGGAYIPTVRTRRMTYSVTLVQKQAQREGHSFALPLLDLIADAVTGWVPEVPGLEFATGFELDNERFVQVTEASQFIYEQNYSVNVSISDGRFYTQPCAAFDPISVFDFLPTRKCLQTSDGDATGLAVWTRVTGPETNESYIVEDKNACDCPSGVSLELTCGAEENGEATYKFTPQSAFTYGNNGESQIDESKVVTGNLSKVWKCYKTKSGNRPPWFKLNIDFALWKNEPEELGSRDAKNSTSKMYKMETSKERDFEC
tara:strand:- start:247 stop:1188 length:942 start_codon:yes stop_codon:yes gene_type:complete